MNRLIFLLFVLISVFLSAYRFDLPIFKSEISIPKKWPKPTYDLSEKAISEEGFQLGRSLFYDPMLSRDSTISCATCHLQYTGFTHVDHNVSHGIDGRKGTRNAPALINLAWKKLFHWDGGVNHIEAQGVNPLTHPAEMDNTLAEVFRRLTLNDDYRKQFQLVYGSDQITAAKLMNALSQFTRSLISANSKYDQVMRKEKGISFTEQEQSGLHLFRQYCVACHQEPLFTSNQFKSNGLSIDPQFNDLGRFAITEQGKDSLQFMIPTLRNSEFTFPYMHDGRFRKLKDVIQHYSENISEKNPYLSNEIKGPIHLSDKQKKDLMAFLYTLTDKQFLYNPRFSFPKK
jgi:cytochrome c peroxidase